VTFGTATHASARRRVRETRRVRCLVLPLAATRCLRSRDCRTILSVQRSTTHLVLIPSYNPGAKVLATVRAARAQWQPVWVIVDGSTDGSTAALTALAQVDPGLRVLVRARNGGKGAALFDGLIEAQRAGFTHALSMDSDGQHPTECIAAFMSASAAAPQAMILGDPVFDASAPRIRLRGRRIANWWTNLATLWAGIHDTLFGFRVYPIAPLVRLMGRSRWMRRFDFDAEAAVRLSWAGVPVVNLPAPVRYFTPAEGGVSHFNYWRDNVLLTSMYLRLLPGLLIRLPVLLARRFG
jgi:glycosyltransferase involved in cell wall biosynthesis